ncbi:hypothetical protein IT415_01815 [bacterium]|nr:hypothetical protein [bacterium]
MRKPPGLAHLAIIIVIVLVVIGGLAYYALRPKQSAQLEQQLEATVLPSLAPNSNQDGFQRITKNNFSISIPLGWREVRPSGVAGDEYAGFESEAGDFITIDIQSGGRGFIADATWRYGYNEDGTIFLIEEQKDTVCDRSQDEGVFCGYKDGKLDLHISLPGEGYRGKWASIFAGNTKNEQADRQVFRDILATFKQN